MARRVLGGAAQPVALFDANGDPFVVTLEGDINVGAVSIPDGQDAAQGAVGDTAWAGTGSATVIALLKALYGLVLTNEELLAVTGAVGASPAANTILDRLKVINDTLGTLSVTTDTSALEALVGDVVADPTANTLLDRVKTVADQLAAGIGVTGP
jgi:hypothetical protein